MRSEDKRVLRLKEGKKAIFGRKNKQLKMAKKRRKTGRGRPCGITTGSEAFLLWRKRGESVGRRIGYASWLHGLVFSQSIEGKFNCLCSFSGKLFFPSFWGPDLLVYTCFFKTSRRSLACGIMWIQDEAFLFHSSVNNGLRD